MVKKLEINKLPRTSLACGYRLESCRQCYTKVVKVSLRKLVIAGLALALLVLDLLALDDITTGNEPNYWGEYTILLLSLVFYVSILLRLKKKK